MKRILLVEDDEFLQQLYSDILSSEYSLEVIGDGKEAFDRIKKSSFDLILLDITLPSMRGDQIIEQLPQENTNKIVILTNTSDEKELEDILSRTEGIIYKSKIDPVDLVQQVKSFVN